MAFYCYGLKGICKCDILCRDCKFYDDSGGMEVKTNADRIRAMSDVELREFMCSITKCEVCRYENWGGCGLMEWLKQPVEED